MTGDVVYQLSHPLILGPELLENGLRREQFREARHQRYQSLFRHHGDGLVVLTSLPEERVGEVRVFSVFALR